MGNKSQKIFNEDQFSNLSVLNLSLESKKINNSEKSEASEDSENFNYPVSIIEDLKKEVDLPIENESEESSEFLLEGKEEEVKLNILFENDDEDNFNEKRSKTFNVPKISIKCKNKPRPHPKESEEHISPLRLSTKTYGSIPKWGKKPNDAIIDFEKDTIDCKSCNDDESLDTFFLFNSDTERTTPNVEDLNDLLNCRKRMTIFKNSINDRNCKEYENILNIDDIFAKTNDNKSNGNRKKNVFWHKHIKLQQNKNKFSISHTKRIMSQPLIDAYDIESEEDEDKKTDGLFILGILESAANERKGRKTVNA